MRVRIVIIALVSVLLVACKSYDGVYSPGCVAYEGSRISLSNGDFVWEKFTDAVVLDDDGNTVNQFPGYPLMGTYRVEAQNLIMESETGDTLPDMYLQKKDENLYLLTAAQLKFLGETGDFPDCPLVLGGI